MRHINETHQGDTSMRHINETHQGDTSMRHINEAHQWPHTNSGALLTSPRPSIEWCGKYGKELASLPPDCFLKVKLRALSLSPPRDLLCAHPRAGEMGRGECGDRIRGISMAVLAEQGGNNSHFCANF